MEMNTSITTYDEYYCDQVSTRASNTPCRVFVGGAEVGAGPFNFNSFFTNWTSSTSAARLCYRPIA